MTGVQTCALPIFASNGNRYDQVEGEVHQKFTAATGTAARYGAGSGGSKQYTHQKHISNKNVKVKTLGEHAHQHDEGSMTTKVQQNFNVQSVGGNISAKADGGSIQHQASQDIIHKALSNFQATAGASMDMRAPTGQASFAGMQTAVNALGGVLNLVGQGGGINVDSLGGLLNLNGGIGSIISALGLQLNFDFGQSGDAESPPEAQGTQAEQPQQEPGVRRSRGRLSRVRGTARARCAHPHRVVRRPLPRGEPDARRRGAPRR